MLVPLREDPASAALFLDFDGTLAPIVADPAAARPLPEAPRTLGRLARRFGLVVVVSGRPARFLQTALHEVPADAGLRLAGLYGMEQAGVRGPVDAMPEADRWRAVVEEVVGRARASAPDGLGVEPKGLTVTLHWRRAPGTERWARAFAGREMERTGLVGQPGRMALELRPPLGGDKGTVVERLGPGYRAVACFGDDLGDLPAFAALDRLAATGVAVARVAVGDAESPPEVLAAADVVVQGPAGALDLLDGLLDGTF